jgi:hypothetical protein
MTVLVTKANSDFWYKIKEFNTIEDIQHFIEKCRCGIIIEKNTYTDDEIFEFWDGMKAEDIPAIKCCSLHIIIYNSYVE